MTTDQPNSNASQPDANASNNDTVLERVIYLLTQSLGVSASSIKPESSIMGDLGADSLDTIELLMDLEDEFNIEISDADAESLVTVSDIASYVENKFTPD